MDQFVKLVAPTSKPDFVLKLAVFVLLSGALNHFRDLVTNYPHAASYLHNLRDAAWTAVPLCGLGLALIGHLHRLQITLGEQAMQDALTELPNRRAFIDACPADWQKTDTLMIIDIDYFKSVNDTYGHQIGDIALRRFAQFLDGAVPEDAVIGRLGGEEFGLILRGASCDDVRKTALAISAGTKVAMGESEIIEITASVGITRPEKAMTFQDAFAMADRALYTAKARGRAQFCAVPDMCGKVWPKVSQPISVAPPNEPPKTMKQFPRPYLHENSQAHVI